MSGSILIMDIEEKLNYITIHYPDGAEKLTRLLQTALPYVIPKPEQKKSDAANKKPVTKLHKLMSNTIKRETA